MDELPVDVIRLLEKYDGPDVLVRHLTVVHHVAVELTSKISECWPSLLIYKKEVAYGASTHDIGKAIEVEELYQEGNKHEVVGYQLLIENGISENLARFTRTHENWNDDNIRLEDLVVALADNVWKGTRVDELEERLAREISGLINHNYWNVYLEIDKIILEIPVVWNL